MVTREEFVQLFGETVLYSTLVAMRRCGVEPPGSEDDHTDALISAVYAFARLNGGSVTKAYMKLMQYEKRYGMIDLPSSN